MDLGIKNIDTYSRTYYGGNHRGRGDEYFATRSYLHNVPLYTIKIYQKKFSFLILFVIF